jgi:hypothetical protein
MTRGFTLNDACNCYFPTSLNWGTVRDNETFTITIHQIFLATAGIRHHFSVI